MSYAHILALCMSYALTMINGFIIDELCYIISSMTFIMTPTLMVPSFTQGDWCCAKLPKIVHDQNKQFPVAVSKELWKGKERS